MVSILVTGGRGFIGTHLVAELRSRGHDVWTCDLVHGADRQHRRLDTAEYRQLERLFAEQHFDVVYHLAAEYGRWNGEDHYENLWRTNVIGTKHLLRLQEQHRFRLVFFSSAEVYGDYGGRMDEDVMDRLPIRQMNDYAISKWAGELQCLNHAAMFGTETVRIRPVGCYGPGEPDGPYRGVIPVFIRQALRGEPMRVHHGHERIFDYVDDTVRTVANVVDHFAPGEVYNVAGPEDDAVTIEALGEMIVDLCGAPRSLLSPHGPEGFTTKRKEIDCSRARRDLGHDPKIRIREGLARTIAWVKGQSP